MGRMESGRATIHRRNHQQVLSKVIHLPSFGAVWETFVAHIRDASLIDSRAVSALALRCLERARQLLSLLCHQTRRHFDLLL